MFVTGKMIQGMVDQYGQPARASFEVEATPEWLDFLKSTQKHGRNHDVTIYATLEDKVAVIAKHFYPPGLYRAPSGGIHPGESFEEGIAREMREEIGSVIEIQKFLLRTDVCFCDRANPDNSKAWRSFVFSARITEGDFKFTDHNEIKEVRLADWSEFEGYSKIMSASDNAGLLYRAWLHERVMKQLPIGRNP